MCCSFVDGCVASVVFIRCIPDLGVGVSSSIVLFSVVLFLIMLLGVVLFFCCFYLLRMSSLISLMLFFFFFSFWFSWFFFFDAMVFVFFFLIFGGECFLSFCLFGFGSLFFFESAIHVDLPARAARGIVFPFSSFGDAVGRYTRELKIQNTSFRLLTACATGVFTGYDERRYDARLHQLGIQQQPAVGAGQWLRFRQLC